MNKPDLIEKQNRLAELKENNVSLKSQINGFEVKNAIEDLPKVQELEKTLSENSIEIIKKQLSDLSKKMKSYGLLDNSLLALTETSNIIPLKAKK